MIIYPAIDLRGGRVVRLTEGKFDQEKIYGDDPLAGARDFKAAGATWLHVVDLDGARDPTKRQTTLVAKLARGCGLRVQTGGGIRDAVQVAALLAALQGGKQKFTGEAADLLYHLLVLLRVKNLSLADALAVLEKRHAKQA